MIITIRDEQPDDIQYIHHLTKTAFLNEEYSSHTEHYIIDRLRENGQLKISLVALENETIVGHIVISPVTVSSGDQKWMG